MWGYCNLNVCLTHMNFPLQVFKFAVDGDVIIPLVLLCPFCAFLFMVKAGIEKSLNLHGCVLF